MTATAVDTGIDTTDRPRWLEARRSGLGGSDAAAVMGVDPYRTPLDVYLDKLGQGEDRPDTTRMRAGRLLEPVVAQLWEEDTGKTCTPYTRLLRHPDHPELLASLDRTFMGAHGRGVLELKTTQQRNLDAALAKGLVAIPTHWVQVQHYLMVTGWEEAELAYLCDGHAFYRTPVERNDAFIATMFQREVNFWNGHVLPRVPPPPQVGEDVLKLFPRHTPAKVLHADDALLAQIAELKAVREARGEVAHREEDLSRAVQAAMRDAEAVLGPGGEVLVTWKAAADSERIDAKQLREQFPDAYAACCVLRPGGRRFLVK